MKHNQICMTEEDFSTFIGHSKWRKIQALIRKKFESHIKSLTKTFPNDKEKILKDMKQKGDLESIWSYDSPLVWVVTMEYTIIGRDYTLMTFIDIDTKVKKIGFDESGL